ncbi:MAG: hypothetical protein LLF92_08610 [Planctomycetaceae bacterium]|nr:hypothetical protein [Planctomycetaceae bacterium]
MWRTISLFSILVFCISPVFAAWNIDVIDGGGEHSKLAVINGQPAISYQGDDDGELKYARYNGSSWNIEIVDDNNIWAQSTSPAALANGNPAISYWEYMEDNLKYAWYDGAAWHNEILESTGVTGRYTSLAIIGGQPAISYYNSTTRELKYARFDGSAWQFTTIATNVYNLNTSMLALPDGNPAIAYYDNYTLRYAWFNGTIWQTRLVDSSAAVVGQYASLAILPSGRPAISYYDLAYKRLKYAALNETDAWDIQVVDDGTYSLNDFGKYSSLAILPNGNPAISYYDGYNESLKLAIYDNGTWKTMDVDGYYGSQAGMFSSLAVMPDNTLGISYHMGDNYVLKFAQTDTPMLSALLNIDYVATAWTNRLGEDVGVNESAYINETYCSGGGETKNGNKGVYSNVSLTAAEMPGIYQGVISVSGQICDTEICVEVNEVTWDCDQWQHIYEEPGDANGKLEMHIEINPSPAKPIGSASYVHIAAVLGGTDLGASELAYVKVYRNGTLVSDGIGNMYIRAMAGDYLDIDAYLLVVSDGYYARQLNVDVQVLNEKWADICGDSFAQSPDGDVDFFDFAALAARWLDTCTGPDFCGGTDLNNDTVVDIFDLAIFAEDWLAGFVHHPFGWSKFYEETLDTNPGWTTEGLWEWGQPTGSGGSEAGVPDPTAGFTGDNVYGYNLDGDYTNSLAETNLTSTAIDCSGWYNVQLTFRRWLGVESNSYDHATVQVSSDGTEWTTVWQNPNDETADSEWKKIEIDISAVADNQPTVYLRWQMGTTDDNSVYCGWNIDDIQLYGNP